jgi:hypothetical protein
VSIHIAGRRCDDLARRIDVENGSAVPLHALITTIPTVVENLWIVNEQPRHIC